MEEEVSFTHNVSSSNELNERTTNSLSFYPFFSLINFLLKRCRLTWGELCWVSKLLRNNIRYELAVLLSKKCRN